jgi:hypothetical protein
MAQTCKHCGKRPPALFYQQRQGAALGLCSKCVSRPRIAIMYQRTNKDKAWEEHLEQLTQQAKQRKPLFALSKGQRHE